MDRITDLIARRDYKGLAAVPASVYAMKEFYRALLGGCERPFAEHMKENDTVVAAVCHSDEAQRANLVALEHHLTVVAPERVTEIPFVLKTLFEEDIIREKLIIEWARIPDESTSHGVPEAMANNIRMIAKPVIEWLEEDPQSSDEDSEDDL